jgi:hypothetical protein
MVDRQIQRVNGNLSSSSVLLLSFLFLCIIAPVFSVYSPADAAAYDDGYHETTPGNEKIRVNICDEAGSRCDSGDNCINHVCVNPCREGGNPFCSCDCYRDNDITLTPVSYVTPNPDPDPDDGSWVLAVGGLGALAAVMIAAVQKMKNRPKKEKEPPRTKYVLQLSKNEVTISPDKKDSFLAKAWIVDETGRYAPVPSASITLSCPVGGISVSPQSGLGEVRVTVSVTKPLTVQTAVIIVQGQAGGTGISGRVNVKIESELMVGFE